MMLEKTGWWVKQAVKLGYNHAPEERSKIQEQDRRNKEEEISWEIHSED